MNLFVLKPKQIHFHKVRDINIVHTITVINSYWEVDTLDHLVLSYNNDTDHVFPLTSLPYKGNVSSSDPTRTPICWNISQVYIL